MATGFNRFQETSSALSYLTQKSTLISEGPPARYRLLTTRSYIDKNESGRKWTFGQQTINMQNKILLMVGEIGTGKTTLINAMVNYILGVKFEDEVWFEITEEGEDNDKADQSISQTDEVTVYEVFAHDNPICLTIIDTPGYGDTRGTDLDEQIAENLYNLFHSNTGVKEIDAVCLVVKASVNRLSDRQQYIFDAVLSLFGKDIENNIVIFFTYSNGLFPKAALNAIKKAEIPSRKDEKNNPEHFLFDNIQAEERSPDDSFTNNPHLIAWKRTEESLKKLFSSLEEQNKKSLKQTESVLTESKRLKACISNLQNRIEFVESKSQELVQIQKALEENKEKIKRNEEFTFTITKNYKEKVLIENASWWDRKATTCSVCEENCHENNCWLAPNAARCEVMRNEHCTVCTGKCHYTKHVRENKKYVTRSEETKMIFDDITKQYETYDNSAGIKFDTESFINVKKDLECNKEQEREKTSIEKRLIEELDKKEKEKAELVEEACTIIITLYEIALKSDSAFIVQALDFLIPRAEETTKPALAQKLIKMRKIEPKTDERVTAVVGYVKAGWNKIKHFIP